MHEASIDDNGDAEVYPCFPVLGFPALGFPEWGFATDAEDFILS